MACNKKEYLATDIKNKTSQHELSYRYHLFNADHYSICCKKKKKKPVIFQLHSLKYLQ